jgi:hypothetical protein
MNIGLLPASVHFQSPYKHPFDFKSIMVETWRRTNGKWQVVARNGCSPTPTSASTPLLSR